MSRLFKQIQRTQSKESTFVAPVETSFKRQRKFNLLPFFCIISLFAGIVVAYIYTDQDARPSLSKKEVDVTSPIQEVAEVPTEDFQQPMIENTDVAASIEEKTDFESTFPERRNILAIDEPIPEEELIFQPLQWNFEPFRNWLQERWERTLPKLQELRESLSRFAYLDATQPIPEKEISALEKERLENIQRFLKKFKVDAVRIDGSYSRVMANGQAFYVNTVVSQRPRLKLTGINSQEMTFKDEYNQEYKKEISQND